MSLLKKSDEEIIKIADPIWANLVKSSNIKDYGGFTRDLSSQMMYGANEVELGKQWASNKLISSLAEGCKAIGCLRRGLYITVLYRQTSTEIPGDFLGRLVLGEEGDEVKVFGATIFKKIICILYNLWLFGECKLILKKISKIFPHSSKIK